MSFSLLELARNYFLGHTVRQLSAAFDESEPAISQGLQSMVPLVLGGLLVHAQRPGGTAELLTQAQQVYARGLLTDLNELLQGLQPGSAARPALSDRGQQMLRSLLGSNYSTAVASIGQQAGLRPASVRNLLSVVVAVALGLLGRHLAQQNLGPTGLASYLATQRADIQPAVSGLPGEAGSTLAALLGGPRPITAKIVAGASESIARLTGSTGLGFKLATEPGAGPGQPLTPSAGSAAGADNSRNRVAATPHQEATLLGGPAGSNSPLPAGPQLASRLAPSPPIRSAARPVLPATRPGRRWFWLLGLLGVAMLGYFGGRYLKQRALASAATVAVPASVEVATRPRLPATGHYEAASDTYRYDPGTTLLLPLPTGNKLPVGENTAEAQLFYLLTGSPQAWPDSAQAGTLLGQVYFTARAATPTAASQAQLARLAALLQAFPSAQLKLGGFTDNQGLAEASLLLSADRANAVRSALMAQGISPNRIAAQGYGQTHPLASNDTREGRAQNRRVAMLLTKK
ncbi:MAG: OmpA family protein [Janthinobacterium lividum]